MTEELHPNGSNPPDTMEIALAKIHTDSTMDEMLPAPISEQGLADAMRSLGTTIKNHAHTFYGGGDALSISAASEQLSSLLGPRSPIATKALLPLLTNPLYKVKSIRFLIAWSILHDANTTYSLDRTLLPPELARLLIAMDVQSNEASKCALLAKWRQMTAALMESTYDSNGVPQYDSRQSNVRELTEALNVVLEPLASTRTNIDRRNDLENIVKQAARLLYMVFALPTTWEFDWHHPDNKSRELVVFPALRQTSDDQGRALVSFQALTQPQVASMGKMNLQAS